MLKLLYIALGMLISVVCGKDFYKGKKKVRCQNYGKHTFYVFSEGYMMMGLKISLDYISSPLYSCIGVYIVCPYSLRGKKPDLCMGCLPDQ